MEASQGLPIFPSGNSGIQMKVSLQ